MRRKKLLIAAAVAAVAALLLGIFVYQGWFAPEPSTVANEPLPDLGHADGQGATGPDATGAAPQPLRRGDFMGADDFHFARGNVSLYRAANGTFVLHFSGYDAREGPDVYLYLTRNAGDRTTEAVEGQGMRLRVPGGSDDGRATVRGSFNVYLPAGTDALGYGGVTIWCDQFNHFFGHAPLA